MMHILENGENTEYMWIHKISPAQISGVVIHRACYSFTLALMFCTVVIKTRGNATDLSEMNYIVF